jgi:Protease II
MRLSDDQKLADVKDNHTKDVIDYLEEENTYYNTVTKDTLPFQEQLFKEMKRRIKEEDVSVPYKSNGYFYYTRFKTGMQYPIYSRKKGNENAAEELLFDVNKMAEGFEYFHLGGASVSPDNKMVVFATDTVSRRQYFFKD